MEENITRFIQKIEKFFEDFGLALGTTIQFIEDENVFRIKCSDKLWRLANCSRYESSFDEMPRWVKEEVMKIHPEIEEEFEEEYSEMEQFSEKYDFPSRLEFDSEDEYLELKEKYLYEEHEKFLENYILFELVENIGPILKEKFENMADEFGYGVLWDMELKYQSGKYQNIIFFEKEG